MKDIYFITGTIDETSLEGSGGVAKVIISIANDLSLRPGLSIQIYSSFVGERRPHYEINEGVNLIYAQPLFKHRPDSNLTTKGFFWGTVFLKYLFDFIPKLLSKRPIVIVTCTPAATLLFSCLRCLFDFKLLVWEAVTFDSYKGIAGKLRELLFPKTDLVISATEYDLSVYKQIGCKAVHIRNPCILEGTKKKRNVSQNSCLVILAAGRLVPQKGFDLLLDIASCLNKNNNDWKIVIIGNGPDEMALKDKMFLLGLEGWVEFYPFTRDLNYYYDMASIFVLPSRFEGSPLVLIEAQALGIPCIAFDCPTGPREILSHGKSGLLIEPGDVNGFAKAIEILLQNPCLRQQMSENAIEESKKFSLDFIINQWVSMLKDK